MISDYKYLIDIMEILGKKWVVPILLLLLVCEKTTFSKLKKELKITSRALSKKLKILETLGLIEKNFNKGTKNIYYVLSDKGNTLSSLLLSLNK